MTAGHEGTNEENNKKNKNKTRREKGEEVVIFFGSRSLARQGSFFHEDF